MSLIRRKPKAESPFMPLKEAAELLSLDESTVRKGLAGTEHFTKVRQGKGQKQRIFLLRAEVDAHLQSLITNAIAQKERHLHLVYGT